MTFYENVASTFIGALLAFAFGMVAFYFTEKIRSDKSKLKLTTSFLKELDYNIRYLNSQHDALTEIIESMAQNTKPILKGISFKNYQRTLLDQYYFHGHAFDSLSPEDILIFSMVLDYVTGPKADNINELTIQWNKGTAPNDAATMIMHERDFLRKTVISYDNVYNKLKQA